MRSAAAHAARAHRITSGPAWYLLTHTPYFGRPAETIRGITKATDRLTHDVLPPVVNIASDVARGSRGGGFAALLPALGGQAPALERAASIATETRAEVRQLPGSPWPHAVGHAHTRLVRLLDRIVPATADAAVAARVLPPVLGQHNPRRYFVVVQNTAEARGTGGMPGAFAVITADRGQLGFEALGNDDAVTGSNPEVDLGAEFTARYGRAQPTRYWANSNLSPHFPHAARIWSATWHQRSGRQVDGVVGLDPTVLSRLLRVTGPRRLADGTQLTADNVLDLAERTGYARYPDDAQRKAFLLDVARTASGSLVNALQDPRRLAGLVRAVYGDAAEGRLKMWSARENEQRLLATRPWGGTFPEDPGPFAGLVVNNAAGGKLDYYLERELSWNPGPCTSRGRLVSARITLRNMAPTSGLPAYVTQRGDKPSYRTRPGDNRLLLSYYASVGAHLTGASLDGRPAMLQSGVERRHPVYTLDVELPAQGTRTLTLDLVEPISDREPVLWRQPLVTPLRAHVGPYPACGD
ncbi:hypothetical protein SUDANB51_02886 [Streptomyces sp. enrichment culture]|uniref:DUF4012 domain-containing protein n=1 Tax=Streptomyces sp. SudanB52_2052 TaxID=3035276 RepID=UPI003F54FCD1